MQIYVKTFIFQKKSGFVDLRFLKPTDAHFLNLANWFQQPIPKLKMLNFLELLINQFVSDKKKTIKTKLRGKYKTAVSQNQVKWGLFLCKISFKYRKVKVQICLL